MPDDVKLALGDEFDSDRWYEIRDKGIVPLYLEDIEINMGPSIVTRSNLAESSHLIENDDLTPPNKENDDEILLKLVSDQTLKQLNELATLGLLTDNELTLAEVPTLYQNRRQLAQTGDISPDEVEPDELVDEADPIQESPQTRDAGGLNPENIIPGNRLRKRVRFSLPTS